jgi:peptidoglycan/LPS O-acetylase OafA/YrhL
VAGIRTPQAITLAPRLRNVPAFDGVRGLGVITIIAIHAAPLVLESFSAVLDIFLALSAFLVTTLLLEEGERSGTISVRRFLTKRAWRLLPALYVTLAVATVLAAVLFAVAGDNPDLEGFTLADFVRREIIPAGLYVYNLVNPLGYPNQGVALYQMWSLSLEQQFYVVVAFMAGLMVARRWVVQVAVVLAALAVAIQVARLTGHFGPINFWLQRPDALMLGVVAAVVNSRLPEQLTPTQRRAVAVGGWVGVVAMGVVMLWSIKSLERFGIYVPYLPAEPAEGVDPQVAFREAMAALAAGNYWVKWGFTIVNWAMVAVLIAIVRQREWIVSRALTLRPVRAVGRMSYSLYLIHTLPILLFVGAIPRSNAPLRIVVAWITAFVFAWPLYQFVEKRSVARKERVDAAPPSTGPTAGAAA